MSWGRTRPRSTTRGSSWATNASAGTTRTNPMADSDPTASEMEGSGPEQEAGGGWPIPAVRYRPLAHREPSNMADVLERVLDKGIVIAGDITIDLLQIELLTIKLRLLVASADKARELGIDWWSNDPFLSGRSRNGEGPTLRERIDRLERVLEA